MKKLFLLFIVFCSVLSLNAQEDCMTFFPNDPGSILINKTYDAKGDFLYTMTYRIEQYYDYTPGTDTQIRFVLTDAKDKVMDQGELYARCDDGQFYLQMTNRPLAPDYIDVLSSDTELIGDFLSYPNTFDDDLAEITSLNLDGGDLTIQSKSDKKGIVNLRLYNRRYEGNEKITTPVRTFDAAKVSFDFEVTKDNKTTYYKGIEWYAPKAGIVRSETRDKDNNLINYTELTSLSAK